MAAAEASLHAIVAEIIGRPEFDGARWGICAQRRGQQQVQSWPWAIQ